MIQRHYFFRWTLQWNLEWQAILMTKAATVCRATGNTVLLDVMYVVPVKGFGGDIVHK